MTRWNKLFESHQFKSTFDSALIALSQVELDATAPVLLIEELARLSKVLAYLEGLLETIDFDLVPAGKWDEVAPHMASCANEINSFLSDSDGVHLNEANKYLDHVLESVRPFIPFVSKSSRALARAINEEQRIVAKHLLEASNAIAEIIVKIKADAADAVAAKNLSKEIASSLALVRNEVLGKDAEKGLVTKLQEIQADVEDSQKQINQAYDDIVAGVGDDLSKHAEIVDVLKKAKKDANDVASVLAATRKQVTGLEEFFATVFGVRNEEGTFSGGLDEDLKALQSRLVEFQAKQESRYKALNGQIESLLPGATSAGLASAYKEMKDSFERPIRFFSRVFFAAIGVLAFGSIVLHIDVISSSGVEFVDFSEWQSVLKSLVYKVPFYGPAVWLAYYASKRRSECQRLQQEYAHKEALAKSYDSYKKQIDELGLDGKELMGILLQKAIEAVSYNASTTLDGRHGDRMPVHDFVSGVEDSVERRTK